jgi:tRNA(Ile2)-agmatinylcytidine synthase
MDNVFRTCEEAVERFSVLEDPQTNPGLAIVQGEVPDALGELYERALHRILKVDDALEAVEGKTSKVRGWKNKMGLIGALSAIGADLDRNCTYEAIMYRSIESKARVRDVERAIIVEASKRFHDTFFNVDERGRVVCIPRSPCPVILGIRSTTPSEALLAASTIKVREVERWVLWRTNQHTDAHIEPVSSLEAAIPYSSVRVEAQVATIPTYTEGGHLMFKVRDAWGREMPCFAYEPTKTFRKALSGLIPGDGVRVWASVRPPEGRHPASLSLEKLEVLSLTKRTLSKNPRCPLCGGRTASMGKGQGLRCRSCGNRDPTLLPTRKDIERKMALGPIQPPMCAWRHLFEPISLPEADPKPYTGPLWGTGHP